MMTTGVLPRAIPINEAEESKWTIVRWYALYTRSRHEKFVSDHLRQKGIETFLPLRTFRRRWTDRFKIIQEPLFKGYVFVHTPLKERFQVLNTPGVVRFVGRSAAEPAEVREQDLVAIRRFLEERIPIDPFPYLKEGQRVWIRSGPFKGIEGFVVRKANYCRLVISLDLLLQSISVEIDAACIEPV